MSVDAPIRPHRRRVSFVLGIWQMCVLFACLDQADEMDRAPDEDHLVLYGAKLPDDLREAMSLLAGATSRSWTSVTWVEDLLLKPSRPGEGDAGLVDELRKRIDIQSCDELWLCKLFDFAEKVVLEAFPTAKVRLYEDGMHSYVDQPVVRGSVAGARHGLDYLSYRIGRLTFGRNDCWWTPGVWESHVSRVEQSWWVLPRALGLGGPRWGQKCYLDLERLRSSVALAGSLSGFAGWQPLSRRPLAIVLGQAFARWGIMKEDDEFEVNHDVCRGLLRDGFEVQFKDHPRLEYGFGPRLLDALAGEGPIGILPLKASWPVEVAVEANDNAAIVSATSTSLFVCASLFRSASYSYASDLRLPIWHRAHRWMAALAAESFAPPSQAWCHFGIYSPAVAV